MKRVLGVLLAACAPSEPPTTPDTGETVVVDSDTAPDSDTVAPSPCPFDGPLLDLERAGADELGALVEPALRWWALQVVQRAERDAPVSTWLADLEAVRGALGALPEGLRDTLSTCGLEGELPVAPSSSACEVSCLRHVAVNPVDAGWLAAVERAGARAPWASWVRLAEGRADAIDADDARRQVLTALQEVGIVDPYITPAEPDAGRAIALWTAEQVRRTATRHLAVVEAVQACEADQAAACLPPATDAIVTSRTLRFVPIEPGRFVMGTPDGDPLRDDDEPQHDVTLTHAFLLGETEVTRTQWTYITARPAVTTPACVGDCPVGAISWVDAAAFANRMSDLDRLDRCYTCGEDGCLSKGDPYACEGWRLPTEAEWEYAARAGGVSRGGLPGGGTLQDASRGVSCGQVPEVYGREPLTTHGWTCMEGGDPVPRAVATRTPNALGLYDLMGNAWEWCHDVYGPLEAEAVTDPSGPLEGKNRVLRGGSFFDPPALLRLGNRNRATTEDPTPLFGFRVARTLDP